MYIKKVEKWNFIIAISLGMLLSGDNHIPWGFFHSAAPPFPSLPQSLSRPWGMIFLLIILIVPPWLVIIIKIKHFIHNFPEYSAYDPTPRPPSVFFTSTILLIALERRRKNKKSSEWGSVFWQKMQKAVVAVLIGLGERHCKQAELSWEIHTEDPYVHWHFIRCLDLLIHYEKCKLCSIRGWRGGRVSCSQEQPSHVPNYQQFNKEGKWVQIKIYFQWLGHPLYFPECRAAISFKPEKGSERLVEMLAGFCLCMGRRREHSWNFVKSEYLCTKCSLPKSDTFLLHLFTFHSNFFPLQTGRG